MKTRRNGKQVEIWLLLFFIPLYYLVPLGADKWVIWPCLIVSYYYVYRVFKNPEILFHNIKTYFKIETFFLVFYYILFFYPYQSYVLGNFDIISKTIGYGNSYFEYTNPSIVLSTIGLISFMLGGKIITGKRKLESDEIIQEEEMTFFSKKYAIPSLFAISSLAVLLLLVFLQTDAAKILFIGAYQGSVTGNITEDGIYILLTLISTMIIGFILVYYLQFKKLNLGIIYSSFVPIIWFLILLITGDRNLFFIMGLTIISGYYILYKEISRRKLVFYAVGAYFLFVIIGIVRHLDVNDLSSIGESLTSEEIFGTSLEEGSFANTTITSRAALSIVPEKQDFYYGKFILIGVSGIIPYSRSIWVSEDDKQIASSKVLGDEILGPRSNWGTGSNIISDIYLQFGVGGVVVLMGVLGWFARKITIRLQNNNDSYLAIIMYLIVLSQLAEIPRYSFAFPIRNLVWSYWLFKILEFVFRHRFFKTRLINSIEGKLE